MPSAPYSSGNLGNPVAAARQRAGGLSAGGIRDFAEHEDGVTVELQRKGTREMVSLDVARVLNCIGRSQIFAYHLNHPLIVNLIARGVLHPDELYLGLRATSDGQMIGAEERIFRQVFHPGPPLRGLLWETTAIPEIRVQAHASPAASWICFICRRGRFSFRIALRKEKRRNAVSKQTLPRPIILPREG